jgi:hypothetical protein
LAISVVDRADAAGVAREVGVTLRPRKILYVTAGLRSGGAEAMLARLATARPGVADEITIASLLPAEAHVARLGAGGVTVVELRFDKTRGVAMGLFKLARLIAESRPDIVQGWMYYGDLAALVALVEAVRCVLSHWGGLARFLDDGRIEIDSNLAKCTFGQPEQEDRCVHRRPIGVVSDGRSSPTSSPAPDLTFIR